MTDKELLEVLKLARERIYELSAWAGIPVEGETITEVNNAIHWLSHWKVEHEPLESESC